MNSRGAQLFPEATSTRSGGACVQGSSLEQVLSRVEDAVLMLQGTTYMLAEKGALLHARGRRLPPSARVGNTTGHSCLRRPCCHAIPYLATFTLLSECA